MEKPKGARFVALPYLSRKVSFLIGVLVTVFLVAFLAFMNTEDKVYSIQGAESIGLSSYSQYVFSEGQYDLSFAIKRSSGVDAYSNTSMQIFLNDKVYVLGKLPEVLNVQITGPAVLRVSEENGYGYMNVLSENGTVTVK